MLLLLLLLFPIRMSRFRGFRIFFFSRFSTLTFFFQFFIFTFLFIIVIFLFFLSRSLFSRFIVSSILPSIHFPRIRPSFFHTRVSLFLSLSLSLSFLARAPIFKENFLHAWRFGKKSVEEIEETFQELSNSRTKFTRLSPKKKKKKTTSLTLL